MKKCGDLVTLIAERWADQGVQMAGGTDHGIDAGLSLVGFQEMALESWDSENAADLGGRRCRVDPTSSC